MDMQGQSHQKMSGQVAGHSTATILCKAQLQCLNWGVWGCAHFRACQVSFDARDGQYIDINLSYIVILRAHNNRIMVD